MDDWTVEKRGVEWQITVYNVPIRWQDVGMANAGWTLSAIVCSANSELRTRGVMVWSCLSWRGFAFLVVLRVTIIAQAYIVVLNTSLIPSVEEQFGDGDCIFQHNRAPVHTERRVVEWLHDNNIQVMDWPSQIPDLNPIEHLWDILERLFRTRSHRPISVLILSAALRESWLPFPKKPSSTWLKVCLRGWKLSMDQHPI